MPEKLELTELTTLKRLPERGRFEREVIDAIIDSALICHLGFVVDDQPYVIPTICARVSDTLYVHGSAASRMLRSIGDGRRVCATMTHIDGLVVARSAFHHSMNYRSVVVLGSARLVEGDDEKALALDAVVDHILPGRPSEVRAHTRNELAATKVLAMPITEASAKLRVGDPIDDDEDLGAPVWAGTVALRVVAGAAVAARDLRPGIAVPASVRAALSR